MRKCSAGLNRVNTHCSSSVATFSPSNICLLVRTDGAIPAEATNIAIPAEATDIAIQPPKVPQDLVKRSTNAFLRSMGSEQWLPGTDRVWFGTEVGGPGRELDLYAAQPDRCVLFICCCLLLPTNLHYSNPWNFPYFILAPTDVLGTFYVKVFRPMQAENVWISKAVMFEVIALDEHRKCMLPLDSTS